MTNPPLDGILSTASEQTIKAFAEVDDSYSRLERLKRLMERDREEEDFLMLASQIIMESV